MIDQVSQITGLGEQLVSAILLVFLRVGAAMALLPAFGESFVPMRIKLFAAMGFTAILVPPMMPELAQASITPATFLTESAVGLTFGIALRLIVMSLQVAGSIAAQSTSLSQLLGGVSADPQPTIGHILLLAGLALATMLGLHVRIAEGFLLTYELVPPNAFAAADTLADWGISHIARAFSLGFSLAAPFVIISLIYNIALGVINRAMPQLMVAFVGAPAITAAGLILLLLTAPLILPVWQNAFERVLEAPFSE